MICRMEACSAQVRARGLCNKHWSWAKREGILEQYALVGQTSSADEIDEHTRRCKECRIAKPLVDFVKNAPMAKGRSLRCKECYRYRQSRWKRDNREANRSHKLKYYQAHLEDWSRWANERRARKTNAVTDGLVSLELLMKLYGGRCDYCGREVKRSADTGDMTAASVDHVVPLSRGGGHTLENTVLACRSCNSRKWTLNADDFRLRLAAAS